MCKIILSDTPQSGVCRTTVIYRFQVGFLGGGASYLVSSLSFPIAHKGSATISGVDCRFRAQICVEFARQNLVLCAAV